MIPTLDLARKLIAEQYNLYSRKSQYPIITSFLITTHENKDARYYRISQKSIITESCHVSH